MFLVSIPVIRQELIKNYGELVIKNRSYNSISSSVVRAWGILGTTIVSCFGILNWRYDRKSERIAGQNSLAIQMAAQNGTTSTLAPHPNENSTAAFQGNIAIQAAVRQSTGTEATGLTGDLFENPPVN
jgi:hypothetical protein